MNNDKCEFCKGAGKEPGEPGCVWCLNTGTKAGQKLLTQPAEQRQGEPAAGPWREGEPPHPWNSEWFLARMKQGHIVVLRPLPEEYAHDYATADETYARRDSIVQWAQLSLSSYVAPQDTHADPGEVERLRELSVTNIMLDVVPGDGSGHEVYAKSVQDVVDKLGQMGDRIEQQESVQAELNEAMKLVLDERDDLRAELAKRDALLAKARWVMNEATDDEGAISAAQFESECAALVAAIDALSASAEPSAPVERDERAAFEADWSARHGVVTDVGARNSFYRLQPLGRYRWPDVQNAWDAWQARAALERKP